MESYWEDLEIPNSLVPLVIRGPTVNCERMRRIHTYAGGKDGIVPKANWPMSPTTNEVIQLIFNYHQALQYFGKAFPDDRICRRYFALEYSHIIRLLLGQKASVRLIITKMEKELGLTFQEDLEVFNDANEAVDAIARAGGLVREIPYMGHPKHQLDHRSEIF